MNTFTATEVRDEADFGGNLRLRHKMLYAYADRLESDEKAAPVYQHRSKSGPMLRWFDCSEETFLAMEHSEHDREHFDRRILYTHSPSADAEKLAELLRKAKGCVSPFSHHDLYHEIEETLATHSAQAQPANEVRHPSPEWFDERLHEELMPNKAQAQPPAASVTDTLAVFEVVSGVEGPCLTISRKADGKPRHEYRLAGPKPWGGGNTTHSFKVHTRELREQIDAIEAALAAQENPMADTVKLQTDPDVIQLVQDRLDAARYRWLRDVADCDAEHPYVVVTKQGDWGKSCDELLDGELLDQAIDAAMENSRG